ADVVVALVLVQEVLAALVKRDRLARKRTGPAILLRCGGAFRLEPTQRALAGLVRLRIGEPSRRGVHFRGDILDVDQHGQDLAAAAQLLIAQGRDEALAQIALAAARQVGEASRDAVMVGEHEPLGRDERARAACLVARNGALYTPEPGGVDVDAVLLFDGVAWKVLERPHAFVRGGGKRHRQQRGEDDETQAKLHTSAPKDADDHSAETTVSVA